MQPENQTPQTEFQNHEVNPPKKPKTLIWAVVLILILLAAGTVAAYFASNGLFSREETTQESEKQKGEYAVEWEGLNVNLVFVNENGEKDIVIDNIDEVLPVPDGYEKEKTPNAIVMYPFPKEDPEKLFFYRIVSHGRIPVFSYDIETKNFDFLENASEYRPDMFGGPESGISSDGLKFFDINVGAFEDPGNIIKVINVTDDSVRDTRLEIKDGETLIYNYLREGPGFEGQPLFKINWLDNNTIEYSVFRDEGMSPDQLKNDRDLIEKRTIKIDF